MHTKQRLLTAFLNFAAILPVYAETSVEKTGGDMSMRMTTEFNKTTSPAASAQAAELIQNDPNLASHRDALTNAMGVLCEHQGNDWNTTHKNKWAMMKRGDFAQAVRTFETSGWGKRDKRDGGINEVQEFKDALGEIATHTGKIPTAPPQPVRAPKPKAPAKPRPKEFNKKANGTPGTGKSNFNDFVDHIKAREGVNLNVYHDSGVLSVGYGHRLLPKDNLKFGDTITQAQADKFLQSDSKKHYNAAKGLASELGVADQPNLVKALGAVSYQLGTAWNKEHKKTWGLMKQGKFAEAAVEAADSEWNKETPVRVQDFQAALKAATPPTPAQQAPTTEMTATVPSV